MGNGDPIAIGWLVGDERSNAGMLIVVAWPTKIIKASISEASSFYSS